MEDEIEVVARLVQMETGKDYFDRYFRPAPVHTYVFETFDKQFFIWQLDHKYSLELVEDHVYHLKAHRGRRLLGGRGVAIKDVKILGEMNVDTK
ncbi:hypothetical protein [Paenibacillus tianjinensis]|uniref:Uncharacterized protein n=1 Tax=Paenibacillus tianjinensis TaxID=2810347 RepID=A0ABX7L5T9_9BACL|nr:hypothetical protein [Paenibacillus tianjinensis]QSF43475.1 hypothetical protein JRJ22_19620 [Paenibacillus tianjinensis]